MAGKKLEGAGLRGQVAGKTSLSTVGKAGKGLTYRGYEIEVLAEKASFEEVAYMLLYGNLPNQEEFNSYSAKLKKSGHDVKLFDCTYLACPFDTKFLVEIC